MLPLLMLLVLSQPAYRYWLYHSYKPPVQERLLDSLVATWRWERNDTLKGSNVNRQPFDPNLSTAKELADLGVPEKMASRIVKYRFNGGKFRIKADLLKIYGMDSILYSQLMPFIQLPESHPPSPVRLAKETKPQLLLDINLADSIQLMSIRGVGPSRSRTIVRYRERLGGFVSIDQISEVYGLDSATVDQIKKRIFIRSDFKPRQIPINSVTEWQLKSHPYIKFNLAKSIAAYRFQHGSFRTPDDLKQIQLLDEVMFQKIKPYLTMKDSL